MAKRRLFRDYYSDGSCTNCGTVHDSFLCPKPTKSSPPIESTGSTMSMNRETALQAVVQATDDNGAASMNVQAAKQWLEEEAAKLAEAEIAEDVVGKLNAAAEAAGECVHHLAQLGLSLETFQEALEALE